jgi:hypothetical protein
LQDIELAKSSSGGGTNGEHGSKPGEPGASGYAPGHERAGDRDRDDRTTIEWDVTVMIEL